MKHFYTFACCFLFAAGVQAQHIDSLVVSPANPTTLTPVTIYPYLSFNYSSCNTGGSAGSVNGSLVQMSGFHCMGMLSTLCNDIDTVSLGLLPAGTYSMMYLLDGGFGLPTCSPAFVPFDTLYSSFTVTLATGVDEQQAGIFSIAPNPSADGKLTVERPQHQDGDALVLYTADGRLAQRSVLQSEKETVSTTVAPGLYFAGVERKGSFGVLKKLIILK